MNEFESIRSLQILLVEDNPGDVELTKAALRRCKVSNHLSVASDGEQALEMLRREGDDGDVWQPDLVLLDLNMPKKGGLEVLSEMKADPDFRRIPVVIMTSSKAEEDIVRSYDLHANCFVTKPVDLEQFRKVVKSIEDFWFTIVRLPSAVCS